MTLLRRGLASAFALWLVVSLCFLLLKLAPGGPFDQERQASQESLAALQAHYGLDRPWSEQYLDYMAGLLRGDLGPSFQYPGRSVAELMLAALPVTLQLGLIAMLLSIGLALPLALLGTQARLATAVSWLAQILLVVPKFVWAPLLVLGFAITWQLLPAGGWDGGWERMVLPVVTLAAPQVGILVSALAQGLREALASEAVVAGRARGISERRLLWRHALPLALPLAASCLPAVAIALLTGSAIVEQVFGIPGMGRLLVQAAVNRDYTVVLGCVLVVTALVTLVNLLCELLQRWLDPR